ncbi:ribonuclease domain-containing protein [Azospira inquinata]|uniref:Ribonuclease n=1 Tax=Azospira inquinata TaxID=2785627 RepID=A0A975XVJ5_9RHOO|nr:ribonuclease domain-containing protein [Azospira inquinata]QWT47481.1 ribonuclease [Azospira inquinata]QWT49894.1 ribonuclease [Azospira inquinata]
MKRLLWWLSLLGALVCLLPTQTQARAFYSSAGVVRAQDLPQEAWDTLSLIKRGGPFPYARDGGVFGNYERRLPSRPRGYYREYTVPTPGLRNRGPRRIIAGQGPGQDVRTSGEYYYSDDHYRSFHRIRE